MRLQSHFKGLPVKIEIHMSACNFTCNQIHILLYDKHCVVKRN